MRFNPILISTAGSWVSGCRFQIFIARRKTINFCNNRDRPDPHAAAVRREISVHVLIQLHFRMYNLKNDIMIMILQIASMLQFRMTYTLGSLYNLSNSEEETTETDLRTIG